MRRSWAVVLLAVAACQPADEAQVEAADSVAVAAEVPAEPVRFENALSLGDSLTLDTVTPVSDILARPQEFLGKRVLVKGQIVGVCQKAGCWMDIVAGAGADTIEVKVEDGVIVFPKDGAGRQALVEGTVEELKLTKEQALEKAREKAGDGGPAVDPAQFTGPVTLYRIRGIGMQIL